MKKILILPFLIIIKLSTWAQTNSDVADPTLIKLKARILNSADSSAIPYTNIILHRTHSGTITNSEGYFSLEMLNIDSLEVTSVGFRKMIFKIPPSYTSSETLIFYMRPVLYNIGEVTVKGDAQKLEFFEHGQPTDIPLELRGDAFNKKPTVFQSMKSPASYLQYKFSKKEKEKREVRTAMSEEKQWEAFSEKYNKELVMKLTGLDEAYADTFIVWFNAQNLLPYSASEYQVKTSILKNYPLFKQNYHLK